MTTTDTLMTDPTTEAGRRYWQEARAREERAETAGQRTEQEIQNLKWDWLGDPCWDIEDTEGFEAHRDELRAYRREVENERRRELREEREAKADEIGCPGNVVLAEYVLSLEYTIARLTARVDRMEGR